MKIRSRKIRDFAPRSTYRACRVGVRNFLFRYIHTGCARAMLCYVIPALVLPLIFYYDTSRILPLLTTSSSIHPSVLTVSHLTSTGSLSSAWPADLFCTSSSHFLSLLRRSLFLSLLLFLFRMGSLFFFLGTGIISVVRNITQVQPSTPSTHSS